MKRLLCVFLVITFLYPSFINAYALKTDASSAVTMDAASGVLLYAKNENVRRSMASTTKIMSALIVLEYGCLDKAYTVKAADAMVEGTALGIQKGDVLRVEALLYGLLMVSGNDAAHALANAVCGSQKAFVRLMNAKAKQLHLKNTHFENPAGLTHSSHYSTAKDMALLSAYALRNKHFQKICALTDAAISFIQPKKTVSLHNHNRLLREYEGCIGVKTGYTADAGRCLVSAAKKGEQTVIAVTLNDPNDWKDHKHLLDDAFSKSRQVHFSLKKMRIPVVGSTINYLSAQQSEISVCIPDSVKNEVKLEIHAPHFLYAPIKKGQAVAEALIIYRSKVLKRVSLYAFQSAQRQKSDEGILKRILHYGKFGSQTSKVYGG